MRDFNLDFERLLLRLQEINCTLPPVVKAWLYLDKLRLSEGEELALLSSVGNRYDARLLQQAALLQDRHLRRQPAGLDMSKGKAGWQRSTRWPRSSQQVHMTEELVEDEATDGELEEARESDDDLVDEQTAENHHTAYVAYQAAMDKYRAAFRGRGTHQEKLQRRNEERLKLAKARSFCSACKRRGHWHKDPECPLRGKSTDGGGVKVNTAQVCNHVYTVEAVRSVYTVFTNEAEHLLETEQSSQQAWVANSEQAPDEQQGASGGTDMKAIVDTACTRTVAGHQCSRSTASSWTSSGSR